MTFADIQNRVFFLTGTSSTSFTNANLTLAVGRAMERVGSLINHADDRWQFDDSNLTDLPSGTMAVSSSQKDYPIPTAHLTLDRVEILYTSGGTWELLKPIDQHDIRNQALSAYLSGTGLPIQYDKVGNSLFLYPTPNYTLAAALKLYFTRAPLLYSYTLGTFTDATGSSASSPGFNSLFHDLVALWAAYDYAIAFGKKNANQIFTEIERKEKELYDFYGQRSRDERPRLTVGTQRQGGISGRISDSYDDSTR